MTTTCIGRRTTTIAAALMVTALVPAHAAAADAPVTTPASAGSRRLIVSIPDRKLAIVENGEIVTVFPVAVGKPSTPTPAGTFTVVNRITNPTHYRPGKVTGPGPANPLGTRWIGLSRKGYGIHGTDEPRSIGRASSHGCIRLRNADVERLFERVRTGDLVEFHVERTSELARLFDETR